MKRGRPKLIQSPEKLWELFQAYKKKVKDDPILVHDFVGRNGESVRREKERPLTLEGFENFVADVPGMPWHLNDYFANSNGAYEEFSSICSRIRRQIRDDQINGGMAGIYNPSITQRLNNLVERTDNRVIVEQPFFGDDEKDEQEDS